MEGSGRVLSVRFDLRFGRGLEWLADDEAE